MPRVISNNFVSRGSGQYDLRKKRRVVPDVEFKLIAAGYAHSWRCDLEWRAYYFAGPRAMLFLHYFHKVARELGFKINNRVGTKI
jgi:hypothetical protein